MKLYHGRCIAQNPSKFSGECGDVWMCNLKENCKHQYLRPSICAIWASTALILTITATISWLTNLLTKIWLPNILINDHHFSHLSSRKSNFCWLQLIKYEGLLLFLVITDSKWRLLACWRCHFRLFLGLLLTNSTFLLMLCLRSLGLHRLCQGKKKKKKTANVNLCTLDRKCINS